MNMEVKKASNPELNKDGQEGMMELKKETVGNFLGDLHQNIWINTKDLVSEQGNIRNIKDILIYLYHQKFFYANTKGEHSKYLTQQNNAKDFVWKQNDYFEGRVLMIDNATKQWLDQAIKQIKEKWIAKWILKEITNDFAVLSGLGLELNQIARLNPDKDLNKKYLEIKNNKTEEGGTYSSLYSKIRNTLWENEAKLFEKSLKSKNSFALYINWLAKQISDQEKVLRNIETDLTN